MLEKYEMLKHAFFYIYYLCWSVYSLLQYILFAEFTNDVLVFYWLVHTGIEVSGNILHLCGRH